MIKIDPNISIFIQLADYIRTEIYSKKRKPGSKIDSIRDMALLLEVNPNTIKRVYQELDNEGLIFTNGNLGTFVTEDEDLIKKKRDLFITNKLEDFLKIIKDCNVSNEELLEYLQKGNIYGNN